MIDASANRLSLGQVAINPKSNRVNAMPQLLGLLEIEVCIVDIDTMGCQSAIARRIANQGPILSCR